MPEPIELDETLYSLTPEEVAFYLTWTGINDEAELGRHILAIQARAYKIFPYPCIRRFSFTKLRIQNHPAYKRVLAYGQDHSDAVYLELGCCFGNEARKVMLDGYPGQNIIATDLHQEFWELGFELFKDNASKCPISFIQGDILSLEMLDPSMDKASARPDLSEVTRLTQMLGYVSAIHAAAFFHLFSEENQMKVARGCMSLLTGLPGTIAFGSHIGASNSGAYQSGTGRTMFCHSPQSWEEMWRNVAKEGGRNREIEVWTKLIEMPGNDPLFTEGRGWMVWCINLV